VSALTRRVGASAARGAWISASPTAGIVALCTGVGLLGLWNVAHYAPIDGYDAAEHMAYADGLIPGLHLPQGIAANEYYTPPGYYAVAGTLDWIARGIGLGEPHRAGSAVNVLFLVGAVALVWKIARELFPGQERLAVAAAAFTALLPVTVKDSAMFHPETMSLFLTTLALWLCVRTFADRRYAVALGVVLGVDQLVRVAALWAVAASVIALAVGRRWRQLAVVVVIAALIPAPWYVHQTLRYGGKGLYGATPGYGNVSSGPGATSRPTGHRPFWARRPAGFYLDPGVPAVLVRPYTPHLNNLVVPTTYSELWGDYVGVWAWIARSPASVPTAAVRHRLQIQNVVGALPTLLAVGGWLLFLARSRRKPEWLVVALVPLLGLLGYLFFTVNYALENGTMLKATYMLSTTAGWAVGFGYALSRLTGRAWNVVVACLALSVVVELPFLVQA
jgi:hypothetical protein